VIDVSSFKNSSSEIYEGLQEEEIKLADFVLGADTARLTCLLTTSYSLPPYCKKMNLIRCFMVTVGGDKSIRFPADTTHD